MNQHNDTLIILAEKAKLHPNWFDDNPEIEKLAELIIRECIDVCKSRVGNSDYNTGRMHCVSDLKEHFGIV